MPLKENVRNVLLIDVYRIEYDGFMMCIPTGHFPPPTTPEELGARILIQERYDKFGESEEVEMEVESEDDDDEREDRNDGHPTQPDQDTQLQDMDEVRRQTKKPDDCANSASLTV